MNEALAHGALVVVGASLAGVRCVEALRREGATGPITLIGEETDRPYDRPPLSKQFLAGTVGPERLWLQRAESAMDDLGVSVRPGVSATGLDLDAGMVHTTAGEVPFDGLVVATGTSVRRLPHPADAPVFYLRTLADSVRLQEHLVPGAKVVVIGAGFIGAEVASTAHGLDCDVTIVEALPVPLERPLGPEMGAACAALHARNGVHVRTGVGVASLQRRSVVLDDGSVIASDAIVVGIGVTPNTQWLDGSGIFLDNGVMCDEMCRVRTVDGASLDHVVSCGDVARWPNELFEETMRIEHWTNAVEMSTHAAATLLGARVPFSPVPYFWSDQYGVKIQFFGRSTDFDEVRVVEGSPTAGAGLALYRRGDRLIGVLGLQRMRAVIGLRTLLAERASWDEALAHTAQS